MLARTVSGKQHAKTGDVMRSQNLSRTLRVGAIMLLLSVVGHSVRADDLFSRRPLQSAIDDSVISTPKQPVTPRETESPVPQKNVDEGSLEKMLQQTGYSVKQIKDAGLLIQIKAGKWTIPTLVSLSKDGSQVWMAMVLKTLTNVSDLDADRLIGLMEANRKYGPAFFTFNRETKRIELRRAVRNLELDAKVLKLQIDILALVAGETATLWSFDSSAGKAPSGNSGNSTPSKPAVSREVGRWVSQLSGGQGFALRLDADGSFALVHRKADGSTETSRGTYTLSENKLTLKGSDQPALEGTVTFSSNDAFNFVIGNGNGLRFERK